MVEFSGGESESESGGICDESVHDSMDKGEILGFRRGAILRLASSCSDNGGAAAGTVVAWGDNEGGIVRFSCGGEKKVSWEGTGSTGRAVAESCVPTDAVVSCGRTNEGNV